MAGTHAVTCLCTASVLAALLASPAVALPATSSALAARDAPTKHPAAATTQVGLSFNESLSGFAADGCDWPSWPGAYNAGKAAGAGAAFDLDINIADIPSWLADPLHATTAVGNISIAGLTASPNAGGAPVGAGAYLHIFDPHAPTHPPELRMEYHLPFTGTDGQAYALDGVKHLPGNDCLGILTQATTLYVNVTRVGGGTAEAPTCVKSGMVTIGAASVWSLLTSMRMHGGNSSQQFGAFLQFVEFIGGDVIANCLNPNATTTDFHYAWASDGSSGYLLDLIQRPDKLELRLETYVSGGDAADAPAVQVVKQYLPLSELHESANDTVVGMGPHMLLTPAGVSGEVVDASNVSHVVSLSSSFAPSARENLFLPTWAAASPLLSAFVPAVHSTYTTLGPAPTKIGADVTLAPGTPAVRTRYPVPLGELSWLQWSMMSAMAFNATDLQVEVLAMALDVLVPLGWMAPAYVRLDGIEYHLNDPLLAPAVNMTVGGALARNNTVREFAGVLTFDGIVINLTCSAPVGAFAFLEREGSTYIHTTVLGACEAVVQRPGVGAATYTCASALLEVKG